MASGGARIRSGPAPQPDSGRSERRKYRLAALPCTGFDGKPPRFPLAKYSVVHYTKDGDRIDDTKATTAFAKRERAIWRWLWHQPQACAWSLPQYSYLLYDIGLYCRQMVLCESPEAKATDRALLPRYADRIGLSAAGMAALGWKVTVDEIGARRNGIREEEEREAVERPQRRLRG